MRAEWTTIDQNNAATVRIFDKSTAEDKVDKDASIRLSSYMQKLAEANEQILKSKGSDILLRKKKP